MNTIRKSGGDKTTEGKRSISRNLALSQVIIVSLVVAVILGTFYLRQSRNMYLELTEKADEQIIRLDEIISVPLWNFDRDHINGIGMIFKSNELIKFLKITDNRNRVIFLSGDNGDPSLSIVRDKDVYYEGERIGKVEIALSLAEYEDKLKSLIIGIFTAILTAVVAIFLSTGILLRIFLRKPIEELREGMDKVAAGDFSYSLRSGRYSELIAITRRFEGMADKVRLREKALSESEGRFRRLTENAKDIIYRMTLPERTYEYVSPASEEIFGYSPQEMYKTPGISEKIIHPEWRDYILSEISSHMKGKIKGSYEYKIINKSGLEKWVNQRSVLIEDEDGGIVAIEGIVTDITRRKKADDEMKFLRNYLENIVNSMPSMLVGVDPDGRVTQWNLEAEKKTGITADEANGRSLHEIVPFLASEMEKVTEAIKNREPMKDEKVVQSRRGETRYSDVIVYPLIADGVDGAVIRIDDVTDRVRIEEMMIQSEKMLSVGGLAAGMAHEINNPLAGILQNMQVIRNRLSKKLAKNNDIARECETTIDAVDKYMVKRGITGMMKNVSESGERAARIVENMLSFSRKSEFQFLRNDLAQLLDKTVELASNDYDLKKKYDFRQIRIVRDYEPDVPMVYCEGSKIQQVILNVLKNGAQAMADADQPPSDPMFSLRLMVEENMVRIELEDNGPGMDEMTRRRVFEPFFTTKEVGIGTGLGLSVSYFIITENHGGTMSVESEPGKGAKFIIKLPAEKNQE